MWPYRLWCPFISPLGDRRLGLSYQRHFEAPFNTDAELFDWRPGMDQPVSRSCSNEDSDVVLVVADKVKKAIPLLEANRIEQALDLLRELCRDIPEVPVFEIV